MGTLTTTPFQPKGKEAEWRPVYRAFKKLPVDGVIDYETLTDLLGRPFLPDRSPLYRAMRELENKDKRTIEVVTGTGYRVVAAAEHERLARHHQKKSRRQLGKGLRRIRSADRRQLDALAVERLDDMEARFSRLQTMVRTLDDRTKLTEKRQRKTDEKTETVTAQVARLTAALERRGLLDDEAEAA